MKSYKTQRRISLSLRYILLALLAIVWIFPIIWIVLASLTQNNTGFVSTIIPKTFTFENYIQLFQNKRRRNQMQLIQRFRKKAFQE